MIDDGHPMHGNCAEGGFALVEMLVALLLFGILSAIATALTVTSTRSFAATDAQLAQLTSIETARSVLSADLGQALPRPSLAADGKQLRAFTLTPYGFVMVRGGLSGVLPNMEKIAWGFDGQRLLRQTYPAIDGAASGAAVVMLTNVRAVQFRVAADNGWERQWRPRRIENLPRAVEITLSMNDGSTTQMKFEVAA